MPYPWPSFGGFYFQANERPVWGSDSGWNRTPSISQQRPLGSSIDSIVTLAIGSAVRVFECYMTPARFATFQALLNTTALFTDWDRPVPTSYSAYLAAVEQVDRTIQRTCDAGTEPKTVRVRVGLVSQQ